MTENEQAHDQECTRQAAIKSGDLMDVSALARHRGLNHPLAITATVLADIQDLPLNIREDERSRLCGLVSDAAARATHPATAGESPLVFAAGLEQPGAGPGHSYHLRLVRGTGDAGETVYTMLRADEEVQIHNATATEALERITAAVREEIARNAFARDRLYVSLVQTGWKHFEDEEAYLRADGAVEALYDVSHKLGLSDAVARATEEGRRRLRHYMEDREEKGPARLVQVEKEIESILAEVPSSDSTESRDHIQVRKERDRQGYRDLLHERVLLRDDLELAGDTLRYLDGEDIEHS